MSALRPLRPHVTRDGHCRRMKAYLELVKARGSKGQGAEGVDDALGGDSEAGAEASRAPLNIG